MNNPRPLRAQSALSSTRISIHVEKAETTKDTKGGVLPTEHTENTGSKSLLSLLPPVKTARC